MRGINSVFVLVGSLVFVGCATVGDESLSQRTDDWPPMEMTKDDLIKELGPPRSSVVSIANGKTTHVFTWVHAHAEANPALFIPVVGLFVAASGDGMSGDSRALSVSFDTDGKMISRAWSRSRIGRSDPMAQTP